MLILKVNEFDFFLALLLPGAEIKKSPVAFFKEIEIILLAKRFLFVAVEFLILQVTCFLIVISLILPLFGLLISTFVNLKFPLSFPLKSYKLIRTDDSWSWPVFLKSQIPTYLCTFLLTLHITVPPTVPPTFGVLHLSVCAGQNELQINDTHWTEYFYRLC